MEFVQYFSRLWRPQPQDRPLALENSHLGKIPNEVLRTIAENHLSLTDRATFSLTCTQVLTALGTKHLAAISKYDENTEYAFYEFLRLQAKDSTNLVACWRCRTLHSIDTTLWNLLLWSFNLKRQTSVLECWDPMPDQADVAVYPNFNCALARMAMKLHQQGKDCKRLLKCLSQAPIIGIHRGSGRNSPALFSAETKIINDSLFIRKQGILVLESQLPPWGVAHLLPWSMAWWPCSHVARSWQFGYTWFNTFKPFTHILERKFDTRHEDKEDLKKHKRSQCQLCRTEFEIEMETLDGMPVETVALYFTIWQELEAHPIAIEVRPCSQEPEEVGKPRSLASDIRRKFEKDGPFIQFEKGGKFNPASLWRKGDRRKMLKMAERYQNEARSTTI